MSVMEKQLRELWYAVKSAAVKNVDASCPQREEDIEEFLDSGEWELALEHIVEWAQANRMSYPIEPQVTRLRAVMKGLSSE